MTSKRKPDEAATKTPPSNAVTIVSEPGKSRERLWAEIVAAGTLGNAKTLATFAKPIFDEVDLTEAMLALKRQGEAANRGDLSAAEAMLTSQAAALNAIFGELARRAAMNMGEYLDATDRYLRLALKAQTQCRATLETLATIKQGPAIIARQANIAHGPQQVNNGVAATNAQAHARAGETESAKTELLGHSDGNEPDLSQRVHEQASMDKHILG